MITEVNGLSGPINSNGVYYVGVCTQEAYEEIKEVIKNNFDEKEFTPIFSYDPGNGHWSLGLGVSNKKPEPIAPANSVVQTDMVDDLDYFLNKFKAASTEAEMLLYKRRIALMLDALIIYNLKRNKK